MKKWFTTVLAIFFFGVHAQVNLTCDMTRSISGNEICPGEEVVFTVSYDDPLETAMLFSGTGDVVEVAPVGAEYDFGAGQNVSVEFYLKTNYTGPEKQIMLARGDTASGGFDVGVKDGRVFIDFYDDAGTGFEYQGVLTIADNTWKHLAVVFNKSGNASIYVDGAIDGAYPMNNTYGAITGAPGFVFGGAFNASGVPGFRQFFVGAMDEIRIWNVARTAAEIQTNYQNAINPDLQTNLIGYWDFNEGAGLLAVDCSPNNNDGILVSNPAFDNTDVPVITYNFPILWSNGKTSLQIFENPVADTNNFAYTIGYCKYTCSGSDVIYVKNCDEVVEPKGEFASVWAPTAFTPNGDVINETFEVKISEYVTSYEIIIYDRYGDRIFHSMDVTKPWDGTDYNGKQVKGGVYVYKIIYRDQFDEEFVKHGHIKLFR